MKLEQVFEMKNLDYVIITAAKNEERYIRKTIEAIASQNLPPKEWIIVNDGSTDKTEVIVKEFLENCKYIKLITRENRESRNFGSQVKSINYGLSFLTKKDYGFIGNIDADVSFEKNYFKNLIQKFIDNRKLGLAGGYLQEIGKDLKFKMRRLNSFNSVPHAVQLFRKECFDEIKGYVEMPFGGPDTIAEISARMKGWEVRSFDDLIVYHHRKTSTAENRIRNLFKQGRMDNTVGYITLYEIIRCARRSFENPIIISSVVRLAGYFYSKLAKDFSPVPSSIIDYSKREQLKMLKAKLHDYSAGA